MDTRRTADSLRRLGLAAAALSVSGLAGCEGSQAVLHAQGPDAAAIANLGQVMIAGGAIIFVLVMVLALVAVLAPPHRRAWLVSRRAVLGGGVAFPVATLTALLVYSLWMTRAIGGNDAPTLRIEVAGEQFWWRVHYVDTTGQTLVASANEVHIPVGRTVEVSLSTKDVIHSFWVPSLSGKLDMVPGRVNVLRLRAARPGVFRGQCAEYCGLQHARMALHVVAHPPEEFTEWLSHRLGSGALPANIRLARGTGLFVTHCGHCHTVRGTTAQGTLGPDLTNIGSRLTLGAGMFPNTVGALAGWIASAQELKPGSGMPSFGHLAPDELLAIAAYMESLK